MRAFVRSGVGLLLLASCLAGQGCARAGFGSLGDRRDGRPEDLHPSEASSRDRAVEGPSIGDQLVGGERPLSTWLARTRAAR